jgi:transposase
MRFVSAKTTAQQDTLSLHRIRERVVRNRTALSNEIRGLLTEYGIVFPQGIHKLREHLPACIEDDANELTVFSRRTFQDLYEELCEIDSRVEKLETEIGRLSKESEACQRIMKIPGGGTISSSLVPTNEIRIVERRWVWK